jgi:hypothetical protein
MRHARLLALSTALGGALLLSACGSLFGSEASQPVAPAAPVLSAMHVQLLEDVRILSADAMQGRDTGAPGGEMARNYIVGRLEGLGVVLAEAYYHFYGDVELIQLAKALGKFTPCLDSRVIHHHPGYDGREDLREADPVYMKAVEFSDNDATQFKRRLGLINQQKVVRREIWS